MIKVVAPAQHHPTNRTLSEFHNYWGESHGPLFANTKNLRRYVQHLTLHEAYGHDPAPNFDGVSMFWYDEYKPTRVPNDDPELIGLLEAVAGIPMPKPASVRSQPAPPVDPQAMLFKAVLKDDAQLFDRTTTWPMAHKRATVSAVEHVIVEGATTPDMIKAIYIASKLPGLTLHEFFDHWLNYHGHLGATVPGLRRYVQNHAIPEAYAEGGQTHDGWAELWFDDLAVLQRAVQSPQWQAMAEDGATLFDSHQGIGVARERIQKDFDWKYKDWGVNAMSEADVRERLRREGYTALAADPDAPRKIKTAASQEDLAVWTSEHLVTIDDSQIDQRPVRSR
jgi:uncharacterized protein (TIGR02118 family)